MSKFKCPESMEELERIEKLLPLCRKALYEAAQAKLQSGAARTRRDAERQLAEETGRPESAIRAAIRRESQVHKVDALHPACNTDSQACEVDSQEPGQTRTDELTQEKRKLQETGKPVFNRTNESIEWAVWTWNPVTGCKHGCPYCYARDIARRFYPPEIGFNPRFWPERLSAPQNTPVPKSTELKDRLVFTCSMADLFGDWCPGSGLTGS